MRLRSKLLVQTILLVAVLSTASGGIGLYYTYSVADISMTLVEDEAVPILKSKTLENLALEIWLRLLLHASVTDWDTMERVEQELPVLHELVEAGLDELTVFYERIENSRAHAGHNHTIQQEDAAPDSGGQKETDRWAGVQAKWKDFLQSAAQVLELSQDYEKKKAMEAILRGENRSAYNEFSNALGGIIGTHQRQMEVLRDTAQKERQQAGWAILSLTAGMALLALTLVMRFTESLLVKPLERFQSGLLDFFAYLNHETDSVSRIESRGSDELGQMSRLVNRNIEKIEHGIAKDNHLIDEVANIVGKIKAGELRERVQATASNPALNDLKVLLDEVLEIVAGVLDNVGDNLDRLAAGNLDARVVGEYRGEYARLQSSCNGIASQIQEIFGEADEVLSRMAEGDMAARIEGTFSGDFGGIKTAANAMAGKLQKLIQEVSKNLGRLAEGDMAARIASEFPGEFAEIKRATNAMADDLQSVIRDTSSALAQLAGGEMALDFSREFSGDFKQIRKALETTAVKLAEATEQNTVQTWLKSGQSQLGEQTSGDKTLLHLAEDIINFLTPYLDAQIGAFYLLHQEEDEAHTTLKMIASHAYVWRKSGRHEFHIGESLVGQAALEHKTFVIEEPPQDYVHIHSGIGDAAPRMILVAPFLYENEVKGVVELASFKPFTDIHLEFLEQVLPAIAIAINTAESRNRMRQLLEQSEAQSAALRAQQEQMEKQQASLQESNEELTAQSEELQAQTEELQSQSEELQVQQEELRQTNEQLEERTRDLERQQSDIEQKNLALEKAKHAIQIKADELELTGKYKSEFLANMSHELRTPLNSLLILAQMLAENKAGNLDAKQVEQARTIHSAGADLLALINDILDLSKVEAGKVQLHIESFALTKLLDDSRRRFQPLAERKGLELNLAVAEGVPEHLTSDIQRLQQILTNLFSNAFKFTEQGEIGLHVYRPRSEEMTGLELDAAHSIAFSVADTGIGIPADKLQVIFEAFQQADGTTSRRYGGTGLGLSISRQLARLLGGDIRLHSVENRGSTFTLYVPEKLAVPQADGQAADRAATASEQKNPPSSQGGGGWTKEEKTADASSPTPSCEEENKAAPPAAITDDRNALQAGDKSILIIDDDPQFAAILFEAGHDQGYKCLLADNGRDGLTMAEQYTPDGILLDIGLPLVDGFTVMDKLKENLATRHIPIHVISAGEHGHKVKQMGALGYYLKPVNMGQLSDAFKKLRHIVEGEVRRLLIISDSGERCDKIQNLLAAKDVDIEFAETPNRALNLLQTRDFDCAVLDMEAGEALDFLAGLREQPDGQQVPLIFYAERPLTDNEEKYLHEWKGESPLKAVYSPERLVDEVTLFLHQVESELPEEKRNMLRIVHDKEALLKGRKVLLVDDDIRNIYALSSVLQHKGMEVVATDNGKKALKVLAQQADVDIILMDIMMPEMDGYETMRRIRDQERFRKLPIIALTAKAMKDDRSKCLEAGANDYLAKPVDSDQLLSLLRVWLYR